MTCCKGRIRTFTRRLAKAQMRARVVNPLWYALFIPNSSPPRQEGLAANFNTSQCYFFKELILIFAVREGFEPSRGG
jgi:hypothetical protein